MKRLMWTLSLLTIVGVTAVMAQPPGGGRGPGGPGGQGGPGGGRPPQPVIEALDADRDGVISADEIKNASTALSTLDKNKDGKLTEEEIRPMGRGPGGPGGDRGPGNFGGDRGSGAGPGGRGPQEGERRREGDRPGPGGRGEGPDGPPPPPNADRMVDHALQFDTDKDGKLSKDELRKFVDEFIRSMPMPRERGPGGPGGEGRPGAPRGGRPESERPQRPE